MRRIGRAVALAIPVAIALVTTNGCSDVNTDPKAVASISIDSAVSASIVDGDSLRDTLGIARAIHATVYNIRGEPIPGYPIRFHSPDPGVFVDTLSGYISADSIRPNPIRVVAQAAGLQSLADTLYIVPAPDSVYAVNATDSLLYSLRDTTVNVSNPLTVTVIHRGLPQPTPVRGYTVSYAILYPADTLRAQLLSHDGSRSSHIDVTAADGTAGVRVKIRPVLLTSTTDSVVVNAVARFHGALILGTPVRFVLQVKPHP